MSFATLDVALPSVLAIGHSDYAVARIEQLLPGGTCGSAPPRGTRGVLAVATRVLHSRAPIVYLADIGTSTTVAAVVAKMMGRRVVVDTGDAVYALARSVGGRSRWALVTVGVGERLALRCADQVIVRGREHMSLVPRPVTHVPDVAPANAMPSRPSAIRRTLGLDNAFVVGLVGSLRLAPRLGTTYGWDLIEAVSQTHRDVVALIVGDGDGLNWLRHRARQLGVENRCRFTGRVPADRVAEYVNAMDVAISTQSNDLVGRVRTTGKLPLYLACGCPVIATHVGEAARLLGPLNWTLPYGGAVDHAYPGRLAERIEQWRVDDAGADKRRQTAEELAKTEFDDELMRSRVAKVISAVAVAHDGRTNVRPTRRPWRTQRQKVRSGRRPMVLLVAHSVDDDNGTGRVCAELIRYAASDFDFTVVSAVLGERVRPYVTEWRRVPVIRRPFPLRFAWFWIAAAQAIRNLNYDLMHSVGAIVPNQADVVAVHFCHAGFIHGRHNFASPGYSRLHQANTSIARMLAVAGERWCYRTGRVRAFAAVSSGVGRELEAHYPGVPVYVTPNGVDGERFAADSQAREELRAAYSAGEDPVAIFVGGDWDHKGLALAIEALARARTRGASVRLWVVGRGDQPRFSALANRLGVSQTVSFLGVRDDVERILAAADMFVLPSAYETFSLVAYEAAACGLPIVATPVHGVRELVGSGEAGILVERNGQSIAAALYELATDQKLRSHLGRRARERSASFTWQASAQSTMELYRELLGQREPVAA